jgi:hypothetical protein
VSSLGFPGSWRSVRRGSSKCYAERCPNHGPGAGNSCELRHAKVCMTTARVQRQMPVPRTRASRADEIRPAADSRVTARCDGIVARLGHYAQSGPNRADGDMSYFSSNGSGLRTGGPLCLNFCFSAVLYST